MESDDESQPLEGEGVRPGGGTGRVAACEAAAAARVACCETPAATAGEVGWPQVGQKRAVP